MAKLKATPKSFAEARQVLGSKSAVRLGNNTHLVQVAADGEILIAVILHSTQIVRFHSDGRVTLHTGGYRTVTTKERINQFVDGRVFQKDYDWFYAYSDVDRGCMRWSTAEDFKEGMVVSDPAWTAQDESLCTCSNRSWYGEEHDTACALEGKR